MVSMASIPAVVNVIVVSTLLLSTFRCDTETQRLKDILRRFEDAMKNKQQFGTGMHVVPSTMELPGEINKTPSMDLFDDAIWETIGELQRQMDALEGDVHGQREEIDQVKKDVDGMETEVLQLKSKTDILDDVTNEHRGDIVKLKDESIEYNAKFTRIAQGSIGFTAYAPESLSEYNEGEVLQFKSVHYNPGNHFDTNTGKYTCPYHGVYEFGTNISPMINTFSGVVFSVDGVEIDPFIVQSSGTVNDNFQVIYETTTSTLVLECKAGQKVWVQAKVLIRIRANEIAHSKFYGILVNRLDL